MASTTTNDMYGIELDFAPSALGMFILRFPGAVPQAFAFRAVGAALLEQVWHSLLTFSCIHLSGPSSPDCSLLAPCSYWLWSGVSWHAGEYDDRRIISKIAFLHKLIPILLGAKPFRFINHI